MSILTPKTRLVSFRLSQEEYDGLRALCHAQRARSMSDFVRDTMNSILDRWEKASAETAEPADGPGLGARRERREMPPQAVPQDETRREMGALSDMLWSLHRRTEALDRQVSRLFLLLQFRGISAASPAAPGHVHLPPAEARGEDTEAAAAARQREPVR